MLQSIERRLAEQDLRALPLKLRERRERNFADPKIREQMNEDFLRMQTIRADMVNTFSTGGLIDPDILEGSGGGSQASRLPASVDARVVRGLGD